MPIIKNPIYQITWISNSKPDTPNKILTAAEKILKSGVIKEIQKPVITLAGRPNNISNIPVAEAQSELNENPMTMFYSASFNFAAPNNNPSVGLSYNAHSGLATLTIQHLPDDKNLELEKQIKSLLPPKTEFKPFYSFKLEKDVQVDSYRLIEPLGSGTSGEVWRAEVIMPPQGINLNSDETVALKFYYPQALADKYQSIRIHREYSIASKIDHPSVIKVYDILLSPSRGYSFLVMDYVKGDILKNYIPKNGMAYYDIIELGIQLFDGVFALHSKGALHRDLKAANIMITSKPGEPITIKILDLGIVSIVDDISNMTGTSVFLGSKHSAPFEQLVGDEINERSDIYAAGSVLYHCYIGKPMYYRAGPLGGIVRQMFENPASVESKNMGVNVETSLVQFINKCISVDPANRPSKAAECRDALQNLKNAL